MRDSRDSFDSQRQTDVWLGPSSDSQNHFQAIYKVHIYKGHRVYTIIYPRMNSMISVPNSVLVDTTGGGQRELLIPHDNCTVLDTGAQVVQWLQNLRAWVLITVSVSSGFLQN